MPPKQNKKTALYVLLQSTNSSNKTYDVQTMQTIFARFRHKSSGYYIEPPQRFGKIDASDQEIAKITIQSSSQLPPQS